MTTETPISIEDNCEPCVLCSSKYNRSRPSFCQCKHCSIPLCLDCTKEHHEQVLQNAGHLSHHYNQLQELIQSKQIMIVHQTNRAIDDVNDFFDLYITELRQTRHKIVRDLQNVEQNAQTFVDKIKSDLYALSTDIQALTKEGVAQTTKMDHVATEMKKIEARVKTYNVIKTQKLIKIQPELSMKFECSAVNEEVRPYSPDLETEKMDRIDIEEPLFTENTQEWLNQAFTVQEYSTNQSEQNSLIQVDDLLTSDDDDDINGICDNNNNHNNNGNQVKNDDDDDAHDDSSNIKLAGHRVTPYNIDRMASDGENILYTSYFEKDSDLITYCFINNESAHADKCREWDHSHIEDMIWWNSIDKFVCATDDGIYTVDYINGRFKIACVIRGAYLHIRIAANTNNFFLHFTEDDDETNDIAVYTTDFKVARVFDIRNEQFLSTSASFCATNNSLASICTRMEYNYQVLQVNFFDLTLNEFHWIQLGRCDDDDSIEIRTDDRNHFFITTGRRRLYIVSSNGKKQMIELQNDGDCIAVLENQRIAVSRERADIELITY